MNNKIKVAANKYRKAVHNEITLEKAFGYAESVNYNVIFYSSPNDEYLVRYKLTQVAADTTAFTYNELARIIFINNNISYSEKLHALLHEIGHIALGHMGTLYLKNNDEIEAEAEAFVYAVLYDKHTSFSPLIASILMLFSLFAGGIIGYNIHPTQTVMNTESYAEETHPITELVYVTPSGTKYHRSDCRYIKNKDCTALTAAEASQKYAPCSVCRP